MDDIQSLYLIAELTEHMKDRARHKEPPFFLILGAGASVSSGCSSGREIVEDVLRRYHILDGYRTQNPDELSEGEKLKLFWKFLRDNPNNQRRYNVLRRHVEGDKLSPGYICLAELIQAGYFNVILTTNFDIILESSLQSINMVYPKDFTVLINGYQREEHILTNLKRYQEPRVKILKLHGDLYARIFQFRLKEIFEFSKELQQAIEELLEDDAIIVGYSMQDSDFYRCFHKVGGEIWYVNPNEPAFGSLADNVREDKGDMFTLLNGIAGYFDEFFIRLHSYLLQGSQSIKEQRAKFYYESGEKLNNLSDTSEDSGDYLEWAINDFRAASKLGFIEAGVFYFIGQCYDKHPNSLGYNEQAIEAYSDCLKIDSSFKGAHLNRGKRRMEQESYDEAIKDFQLELSFKPRDSDARDWLLLARERKVLEYIDKDRCITNRNYQELFEVSRYIANKELSLLVEAKKLVRKGTGKGTYYTLPGEGE